MYRMRFGILVRGFVQGLGRDSQFWVELGCLLMGIPCLDRDIFGLGFGVFVVSLGYES